MNIDPTQSSPPVSRIDPASGVTSRPRREPSAGDVEQGNGPRDRIELSGGVRGITELDAAGRRAKVRELREQIDTGAYRVDSDGVARRMLDQGEI